MYASLSACGIAAPTFSLSITRYVEGRPARPVSSPLLWPLYHLETSEERETQGSEEEEEACTSLTHASQEQGRKPEEEEEGRGSDLGRHGWGSIARVLGGGYGVEGGCFMVEEPSRRRSSAGRRSQIHEIQILRFRSTR